MRIHNYDDNEVQKLIKKAEVASKIMSLKFNKDFDKLDGLLAPRFRSFLKEAWTAMEEIYPGRCDIHFQLYPRFETIYNTYGSNHVPFVTVFDKFTIEKLYFVIHWPEVTITNGSKREHTIKDLFTRFPCKVGGGSNGKLEFHKIQGMRTTVTLAEFESAYAHSHLQSRNFLLSPNLKCTYSDFCTGDGDINANTSLLNSELDLDIFKLLLYQVQPFVEWESLEGNPYKRFNSVAEKDFKFSQAELSTATAVWKNLKDNARSTPYKLNLDWKYEKGKYVVIDNELFEETLRQLCVYYINDNLVFLYKDEMGNYFTNKKPDASYFLPSPEWAVFRNQKIHFQIQGESAGIKTKRYMHPKIKYYAKQQLELKANSPKIRASAIEQYSKNVLAPTVY